MPTNRVRRRRQPVMQISETQLALLYDRDPPADGDAWERWAFRWAAADSRQSAAALWARAGDQVLEQWIADAPGRRPSTWWRLFAPEPRRRMGGTGTSASEAFAGYLPTYHVGVPDTWIAGVPIDPTNPPMYESQAAFLTRLGLLQPGEQRRLRPAEFEPEPITDILDIAED